MMVTIVIVNRFRKFEISTALTQAKSREPAYSGRQTVGRLWWLVFEIEILKEAMGGQDGIC